MVLLAISFNIYGDLLLYLWPISDFKLGQSSLICDCVVMGNINEADGSVMMGFVSALFVWRKEQAWKSSEVNTKIYQLDEKSTNKWNLSDSMSQVNLPLHWQDRSCVQIYQVPPDTTSRNLVWRKRQLLLTATFFYGAPKGTWTKEKLFNLL